MTVISFGRSGWRAWSWWRNGEINIDVQCNPDQGKYVEQIIQDMEDGKEIEKAYYVPERVYTQENVGEEENVTEGISG